MVVFTNNVYLLVFIFIQAEKIIESMKIINSLQQKYNLLFVTPLLYFFAIFKSFLQTAYIPTSNKIKSPKTVNQL